MRENRLVISHNYLDPRETLQRATAPNLAGASMRFWITFLIVTPIIVSELDREYAHGVITRSVFHLLNQLL